ncbi:hypothetical protein MCEGKSH29_00044 [Candidatus Nanopelagicaceae bacterium]
MLLGKLLVVGTTRNCGATLEKNVKRIVQACKDFDQVTFYFVESDSEDNTRAVLSKLESKYANFKYISMGKLNVLIPDRVERIRYCRNKYIDFLKKRQNSPERFDFVMVADLDKVNSKLSRKSVVSCFTTKINWDACFANQSFGYYDLYALRAPGWINHDIFKELRTAFSRIDANDGKWSSLVQYFQRDRLRKVHIYENMRRFPSHHSWIKVQSAFGGAAIYRADVLSNTDYSAIDLNNEICEHVDLNMKLHNKGKNLFINPQFINSNFNEYNLNRITLIRYLRALKSYIAR